MRVYTFSTPSLECYSWQIQMCTFCGVVVQAKVGELHLALPVSVVTNEDELLGLALSRRVYAEKGGHDYRWIYSQMDQ